MLPLSQRLQGGFIRWVDLDSKNERAGAGGMEERGSERGKEGQKEERPNAVHRGRPMNGNLGTLGATAAIRLSR